MANNIAKPHAVVLNGHDVQVIGFRGQRVVTFAQSMQSTSAQRARHAATCARTA